MWRFSYNVCVVLIMVIIVLGLCHLSEDALLISNLVRNRLREEGRKNEKKTFVNLKCWLLRYQLKVPG